MTKVKRPDIQGIRGLAIAAVLGFHLRERQFPAGFVGVDIFFVLSGFLMSSILAREHAITLTVLKTFYIRRFKRIVPLYAILLLVLFFAVPLILMKRDVIKFLEDVVWAAGFATNIHSIVEKVDYFTEVFDSNVLTHTWSLGVEIQYYLIVPFIYFIQRLVGSRLSLAYIAVLIITSFSFQIFTSTNVSFNFLFSRVWQFLGGAVAHEMISRQKGIKQQPPSVQDCNKRYSPVPTSDDLPLLENEHQPDKYALAIEEDDLAIVKSFNYRDSIPGILSTTIVLTMIIFALSPIQLLDSSSLRVLAIALTATVIVIGNSEDNQSIIFTNRAIVYLGDVSYVVYLVHWPVIIIFKSYWDLIALSNQDIFICLSITFVISIAIHHTIEQCFITASTTVATVVVAAIYIVIFVGIALQVPQAINKAVAESGEVPINLAEAIKWNKDEALTKYLDARPFKDCVDDPEGRKLSGGYHNQKQYECIYKPNRTDGDIDILLIGNSIAHRASTILRTFIDDYPEVRSMRLLAHSGCKPIENECHAYFKGVDKLIKAAHPDITFLIYHDSPKLRAPIKDIKNDTALQAFTKYLTGLSENSMFVVLDEFYPPPGVKVGVANSMHKRLLRNQTLTDLKINYQEFLESYDNYFTRLDEIHIDNVQRRNSSGPLCTEDPGWCWLYNRKDLHPYFFDHLHLSMDGLMLEKDSYKAVLDDLIPKVRASKEANITGLK